MGHKVDEARNPSGQLEPKSFVNPVIAAMEQVGTVYAMIEERDGYALDFGKIKAHISDRTKLILLSSPVNPTGYVYTRRDVEQFVNLAEERNLLLVSDESYDRMVYDRLEHISPYHFFEGDTDQEFHEELCPAYLAGWLHNCPGKPDVLLPQGPGMDGAPLPIHQSEGSGRGTRRSAGLAG